MFQEGNLVVYPSHGVGRISGIEEQAIAGHVLQVVIITFEKDRMTMRLPYAKAKNSGLRNIADSAVIATAMDVLKKPIRSKKMLWSKRAQFYETKINSGDLIQVAEVVRELYRPFPTDEQSYSERQMFQQAFDRFIEEVAASQQIPYETAIENIAKILETA